MGAEIQFDGDGPSFDFSTTVGGYRADLGGGRSVALHLGSDELGNVRWAIRALNNGSETSVGFSDEAMSAVVGMFARLVSDEEAAEADAVTEADIPY